MDIRRFLEILFIKLCIYHMYMYIVGFYFYCVYKLKFPKSPPREVRTLLWNRILFVKLRSVSITRRNKIGKFVFKFQFYDEVILTDH